MKLLVTGSNGFVAGSVMARAAASSWEVHGISRSELLPDTRNIRYHQLDLLDPERLEQCFLDIRPDAVVHAAALANIDFCEQHPEMATAMNVGVTGRIAKLCRDNGTRLVFCSSDSVFDGVKGHYTEEEIPRPVNRYAETKVQAEQVVLAASPENSVARIALVMGLPVMGRGNSFLADMFEKLKRGQPVPFPGNEIRTPIDVITLGLALTELAENKLEGIVHLAGNTRITRFAMAGQIAAAAGYPSPLVVCTDSNALPGRAPRPNDASLENARARQFLKTPMLSLPEALAYILNRKQEVET